MRLRRDGDPKKVKHEPGAAKRIATSVKNGICVAAAPLLGFATLVASPEHIFKNHAPIPLAFTLR